MPAAEHPLVLVGDLNMGPARAARITGMTALVTGRTFPAPAPRLQLDHVLAAGEVTVRHAKTRLMPISDHRAHVVDLA
jgi:endonuclease/exonuclease/phosphatase family metal-dependent hydrolase